MLAPFYFYSSRLIEKYLIFLVILHSIPKAAIKRKEPLQAAGRADGRSRHRHEGQPFGARGRRLDSRQESENNGWPVRAVHAEYAARTDHQLFLEPGKTLYCPCIDAPFWKPQRIAPTVLPLVLCG